MASPPLGQLPSCKRRRVAAHHTSTRPVFINDLSAEILKEVATYLAPISRVLFAVAITPPISPYETIMARSRSKKQKSPSIAGTDWTTLDFGQIEKDLAAKLSDEDVRDVMLHINAANKLKKLVLTNCKNITGIGLNPLSGSTTIEHIDLNLAEQFQRPELFPEPRISCEIVLPILDSIISNEVLCKLKYLQFPKVWRENAWEDLYSTAAVVGYIVDGIPKRVSNLHAFILRYNQELENRGLRCLKCNHELSRQCKISLEDEYAFGTQENFCHQCSNYVCRSCPTEDDNVNHCFCSVCEREYCTKCAPIRCGICEDRIICAGGCLTGTCASPNCDEKLCGDCNEAYACDICNRVWCYETNAENCYQNCLTCGSCNKSCCVECSVNVEANRVPIRCDDCSDVNCRRCLEEGRIYSDCPTCINQCL